MDFALTPEQEHFVRTVRSFADKELAPRSREWDQAEGFPPELWTRMGALGLLGLRTAARWGGSEADLLTVGLAHEAVARGDFTATTAIQLAGLAGEIIGQHGTDDIKERWLPAMIRGEALLALALTEPQVGSDAARLTCRAERDGAGYRITGEKSGISFGMIAHAAIVFARTGPDPGARGVTAFVVPLDLPGVARSRLHDLGERGLARAVLALDGVRVPRSHRLGAEGTGFHQVMRGFDFNRVFIALACLGAAQVSLEETMAYVRERRAFGRMLAAFEGISFPIAEAATHLEAARWLCYRALWLGDRGQPYTKEAAMAKWWAPKLAAEVIHQCLLHHGHYGYTDELPFQQRMRDVIGLEIGDGTAEVMKIVVARELMGRESLPY